MIPSLWNKLFGPPHARPNRSHMFPHGNVEHIEHSRTRKMKFEGLMRERQQIDESSERWRQKMLETIRSFDVLTEEVLSDRVEEKK